MSDAVRLQLRFSLKRALTFTAWPRPLTRVTLQVNLNRGNKQGHKERDQNSGEILYLYNVKIEGEGVRESGVVKIGIHSKKRMEIAPK